MIVWLWEADDDTVDLEVFDPRDNTVTSVELDRFPGEDWGLEFDGPPRAAAPRSIFARTTIA